MENTSFYYGVPDPVVQLEYALYGHPDSPTYWELHCDELVRRCGFEPYGPEWPSVYFHRELKLMLSICVDDFKLSGPKENLAQGWKLLSKVIDFDEPTGTGLYLGCRQHREEITLIDGSKRTCMLYDMEAFLEQCLERHTHRRSDPRR